MGDRNDELQVPAVCGDTPRVSDDDDGSGTDNPADVATDDGDGDDFADYYERWSEYERQHRFDTPITD